MQIVADALDALFDNSTALRLSGCGAAQRVTIRALTGDTYWRWQSCAVFIADPNGVVDTSLQAPGSGTYNGVDPTGPFWSMELNPATQRLSMRGEAISTPWDVSQPVVIALTCEIDGLVTAATALVRRVLGEAVVRKPIRERGLVGTLFHHAQARPAVIFLGGSDGGLNEPWPALLASHGYDVLALAYFGLDGLPRDLSEIPLEYFAAAIELMRERVGGLKLAVIGASRGGELALLLGATFPQIQAVVGYVPSGVTWPGIGIDPTASTRAAWTYRGKPLPFVPQHPTPPTVCESGSLSFTPSFLASLEDRDAVEAASIAVERINGPVLLISGEDDRLWPSTKLANIAMDRLRKHRFPHDFRHLSFAQAGHMIRFPITPTTVRDLYHPLAKVAIALGGNAQADAAAARDSWRAALEFLAKHLR
jgi:pimeloyl-ACP methyl ester carboxylesterase